jgi:YHS domain-containing protein
MKKVLAFVAAALLALAAAPFRFGDSAHAIGLISDRGGRARHPVRLDSGKERYTVIVTATVLPPYAGDVRVAVEGETQPMYSVHFAEPVMDLGLGRRPRSDRRSLRELRPRDRIALWVVIEPTFVDPVCGWRLADPELKVKRDGHYYRFCSRKCRDEFLAAPSVAAGSANGAFRYDIVFWDDETGRAVLSVPVRIGGGEGVDHEL